MESELNNQQPGPVEKSQPEGCSGLAAFIVLSIWIIIISLIAQVTHWTVWQMIFEGSIKLPNVRWIIELTYGILLLIPLVIAVKVVREPVARGRLIALMNLSILAILLSPSRLPAIYDWQLTAVIELGALVIFIVYLAFINRGKIVTITAESKQGIGFYLTGCHHWSLTGYSMGCLGSPGFSNRHFNRPTRSWLHRLCNGCCTTWSKHKRLS